jgi:DNA-binding NtrC family response regulator
VTAAFVLLDADRNFRRALEIALRVEGMEVASVESATQALPIFDSRPVVFAVADSRHPAFEELVDAAVARRVRVVATGPHPELLERAQRRHDVLTLEKPFSAAALLALAREKGPRGVAA